MKKLTFSIILYSYLILAAVSDPGLESIKFPEVKNFNLPVIQKATMSNGIKLRLIRSSRLPLVHLSGFFRGGSVYVPKDKAGLSGFVSNLMRIGGAEGISPEALDEMLESKGIEIEFKDETNYYSVKMSCLKENLGEALGILSKLLISPSFSKDKFQETKTQLYSAIARRNDNPETVNTREIKHIIYGKNSPFSPQIEYEHLARIELSDIQSMYKAFITPDNFLVGLCGPVDMDEAKKMFEENFGGWNTSSSIPPYPTLEKTTSEYRVGFSTLPGLSQSYISIGQLGFIEDIETEASKLLFNQIFGFGMGCRLFNQIRSKLGLTYGIYGGIFTRLLYPGMNLFVTYTKTPSTIQAIDAILEEIRKIRAEKVSETELQEAKDYYINSFVFKYSSPAKILQKKLVDEFYGLREDYSEYILEKIRNVTVDDINAVAKECLNPETLQIYVLGTESLRKELGKYGTVKDIELAIPRVETGKVK